MKPKNKPRSEWGILELLEGKPFGMTGPDIGEALGLGTDMRRCRLWTLKKEGLIVKAGNGSIAVWGLPQYEGTVTASYKLRVAAGRRRDAAARRKRQQHRRILLGKKQMVPAGVTKRLPFPRPSVNSVWSLAA